jgi:predicted nucleic acid-binding Zn finger protein
MEIEQTDEDKYIVKGDTGKSYVVSSTSCTCPQFEFRIKRTGGMCKHMIFISGLSNDDEDVYQRMIDFIRMEKCAEYEAIAREYPNPDSKLEILEKRGEILHNKRKDTYSILE